MRVVMISKALVVGMYQRKLEELARLPGVELTAIVPPAWRDRRGNTVLERAHTAGYRLEVAPIVLNGHYHFHFYPTLGRLLRELRPDILHVDEEPYNLATWHALRLGRAVGAQGLFFTWQNLARRYPWPFSALEQSSYRLACCAIAGNQSAVAVLRSKGYRGPVAVVPQFGVDPDLFAPARPAAPRPASLVIGYAGGLIPEKGIDLLLAACAALPFRAWSLWLAGEGPERAHLAALAASLGIASQVSFLGRLSSGEVAAFYRRLDVFVLPSVTRPNWTEQFGRVLVEAMASQVAVVGSDSGEIPHVIADAGGVFPEGNHEALSGLLAALAGDPDRRAELAAAGRARVLRCYTQAQIAAATYSVYQTLQKQPSQWSVISTENETFPAMRT